MRTLNLGILAHVDAGKTSLTERLLYAAGVIDEIGSVDDGNTQTDSLALERQRGITIKSAVVSFVVDDVTVNLIDTPGHPDFIAEVERVLSVLDGAVLVISAVEGVQAQTRVLMRTLQRLRIPTLIFVNKIDRGGAHDATRAAGHRREADARRSSRWDRRATSAPATPASRRTARPTRRSRPGWPSCSPTTTTRCWPRTSTTRRPSRTAELRDELAAQTRQALVHPVFFGSAITGAGVDALIAGIAELLPAAEGDADGPVSGTVFKVERGPAGREDRVRAHVLGTVRTRDRLRFGGDDERKVTAISVFDRGSAVPRPSVARRADRKALGLGDVQIGDAIGTPRPAVGASPLRPADAGDGRRSPPPRRHGRAARRARPARRAGPADQPASGRHPAGAVRLALRRGAEGGHPGDAGDRLRHRRRVPRDDDDLHRTAGRHRRGGRDHRQGAQSVPRHGRAARRAGADRHRRGVPARGRARRRFRSRSTRPSRTSDTWRHVHDAAARASTAGRSPTARSP